MKVADAATCLPGQHPPIPSGHPCLASWAGCGFLLWFLVQEWLSFSTKPGKCLWFPLGLWPG